MLLSTRKYIILGRQLPGPKPSRPIKRRIKMPTFLRRTRIPVSAAETYRWHERPGAFERLTPPWSRVEVLERSGGIADGRVVFRMYNGPLPVRWVAQHTGAIEGREFRDRQESGPFARWEHVHRFLPAGEHACDLEDRIDYAAPLGAAGALVEPFLIRPMLDRTFAYRHRVTLHDLQVHQAYSGPPLHFLVSGSSGLIGSALCAFLSTGGHRVTRMVRDASRTGDSTVLWNPGSGTIDERNLGAVDVVAHLAGENIAAARWSDRVKQEIRDSRGQATRKLCESLARLSPRPRALICASAIGFYGNRGDELLDEDSPAGRGFLAEVCRDWEAATEPAADAGIRVVHLRIGVVLTPAGGALAKLLVPFRLGAGGRVGDGKQYMSWIAIDDLLAIVLHAARTESLQGAVNAVAPQAVSNAEFTRILGEVLHRPTLFPVPASAARLVFGEMADEMLLASTRVRAKRLEDTAFQFWLPDLKTALRHVLGA
jgi:uncharacterized protein (TIGR01777 family)